MLFTSKEGIQAMGCLSEAPGTLESVEETGGIHIGWTGPHQLSVSPEFIVIQRIMQSASDAWMCMPTWWKPIET